MSSRRRTTLRWSFTALSVLVTLAWLASGWWWFAWTSTKRSVSLAGGVVYLTSYDAASPPEQRGFSVLQASPDYTLRWDWRPRSFVVRLLNARAVSVPIWPMVLLATGAASIPWTLYLREHRRSGMNRCAMCGYPRTGLTPTSPCPECGAAPLSPAPAGAGESLPATKGAL